VGDLVHTLEKNRYIQLCVKEIWSVGKDIRMSALLHEEEKRKEKKRKKKKR
jgi:hypothetical protein